MTNNRFLSPAESEGQSGINKQLLKITLIRCDCGTQSRAAINEEVVSEYAERMSDGDKFPPVIVFFDGNEYYLADGFHRVCAASRNKLLEYECDVRMGTRSDALKFSLGANALHGLKRTNADKRRSVELALAEWPNLSDRAVADICAVTDWLVRDVRKALPQVRESRTCPQPESRVGKDGKQYRVKQTAVAVSEPQQAEADETPLQPATILEAQIETNEDELQEILSRPLAGIKEGVLYHLDVMRADMEMLVENTNGGTLEQDEILAVAVQMELVTKLLNGFAEQFGKPSQN
jgi:hypothetical protein